MHVCTGVSLRCSSGTCQAPDTSAYLVMFVVYGMCMLFFHVSLLQVRERFQCGGCEHGTSQRQAR